MTDLNDTQPSSTGVIGWIKRHKIWSGVIALVAVGIIGGAAGGGSDDKAKKESSTKGTSDPAAKPVATPAPNPQADLAEALRKELDDSNRDNVERVASVVYNKTNGNVQVKWALNDNLTENLIKKSARMDIADILKTLQEFRTSGHKVAAVSLTGTFALADKLGNQSEDTVVRAQYSGSTISQINFDNFLNDNVYDIADDYYLHPAFQ